MDIFTSFIVETAATSFSPGSAWIRYSIFVLTVPVPLTAERSSEPPRSGRTRALELPRLCAQASIPVRDPHGGALYITARTGGKLTPAFISKGCRPLVDVPPTILQQAAAAPIALEGFLRLHTISPGEGLIGRVWQTGQSVCLNEFSEVPELAKLRGSAFGSSSITAASLRYGNQDLGVLALANGPTGPGFSQADFVVFKSIGEC